MAYRFVKQNDEPVEIEFVEDEHEAARDFTPSFWFENRRHYLDDYLQVHNNPWVGGEWPEFIHGMEAEVYHDPLFIELIDDEAVNVYREVETDATV